MSTSKEWWALGKLGNRPYSPVPTDPDNSPLLDPESAPQASEVVGIDLDDPVVAARIHVDSLISRQSSTYSRAAAKYSLKTGRPPPRNYDKWFSFAKENLCLIDEYDQIARDFAPFYKLAQVDPLFFQKRIEIVANLSNNVREAGAIVVKDGQIHMPEGVDFRYWGGGPATFSSFAHLLPDMAFVLSGKDQPRVLFDYRVPGNATMERALKLTEEHPFSLEPRPTAEFFRSRPGCEIPRSPAGFTDTANDDSGFFISSSPGYFTLDLYPVLSVTKVSPCFADILFPSEYYYDKAAASPKFPFPNNIAWEDKKPQIYWRGTSTGGQIVGQNYRQFMRFRLVDVARAHPDLVDAQITRFADLLCFSEDGCDRDAIINEYNMTGGMPQETSYKYKYLLDVDGMTYSGRYLGLLRTGSLVFKATVFEEYFNDWLRPYEHYIPVLPDLSDLVEKVEWARRNDEEARAIQERGREMATRVMSDAQNDCYLFALLLEWAQLQEIARNASGTALD
ncbi:glycosyl transferase family 90-domain-containing protein [Roridomyces roridus]|uniref:Glycosyl transferase family 90-domain-containing protein n=1 Tax=Roridomyces roridus TaxID=1738132 RepID=A0AAD7BYM8_9AGAR|nr:glycosyl transferase family 90-domain-containing protein [Roridomyces roridus]